MVPSFLYRAALFSFLAVTSALPVSNTTHHGGVLLPSRDPFYVAPAGYKKTPPGSILRSRPTPGPLGVFSWLPNLNILASYQILYRTNDAHGEPIATVLSVLIPFKANMSRAISYQDFEDAASLDCAPSYALLKGSNTGTALSKLDYLGQAAILAKGWILAYPDFEGPKAALCSGVTNGQATLDGIRALLSSQDITGIAPRDQVEVQMWGYSGGSIPTEWAAELQPSYAPELKIKGAVVGGTIANLTSSMLAINKGLSAGFIPSGILGIWNDYPNMTDYMNAQLLPHRRNNFMRPLTTCAEANIDEFTKLETLYLHSASFDDKVACFRDNTIFSYDRKANSGDFAEDMGWYFRSSLLDLVSSPEIRSVMAAGGQMGLHGLPQIPMYFYNSVKDTIAPIVDDDALVTKYCNMGIKSLVHKRNTFAGHISNYVLGYSGAMKFVLDRFDGEPAPEGCHIKNVHITWPDLEDFKEFSAEVFATIEELIGQRL